MSKKTNILDLLKVVAPILPAPIYWEDTNSVLLGGNEAVFAATGAMLAEAYVGKTLFELYPADMAQHIKLHNEEVMRTGKVLSQEEVIRDIATNELKYFTAIKAPLYDDNGNIIGIIGTSIDITERKNLEKELVLAKEKAEEANYIKTELIANIGHDFAAPISDVGNIAIMFDCFSDEYPELKDLIDSLTEKAAACEKVRKATIEATAVSNLELKPEKFSTAHELLLLEKEFRSVVESKNIKLIFHPLKPKKEDLIETDRSKFHSILQALISNAINFTEKGEVIVSVLKRGDCFEIQVADTGIGIPSDKYDYIFQPFTKLSRSNKYGANFKGMGSGLYLAKIRANILGATITVVSEVGKGSVFTFSIPIHPISHL